MAILLKINVEFINEVRKNMKLEWYNQELLCILADMEALKQRLFALQKQINDECFLIDYFQQEREKLNK